MKGPYLEQHELEQLEVLLPDAIRDTLRGWKSTRLRGGSESMAFYGNISNSLLKAFDELAAEIKPQPKPVQFKCTVIDDAHPNGIPLEQWAEQQRTERLEYLNAVKGWVKIDEVQSNQEPVVFCMHWIDRWGCNHYVDPKEPHPVNAMPLYTISLQRTEEKNT